MSADVLRQAAALMRERAEGAVAAPWAAEEFQHNGRKTGDGHVFSVPTRETGEFSDEVANTIDMSDAVHIASWHPAVALAVADWLDAQADLHDYFVQNGTLRDWDAVDTDSHAVRVARAYLGESA